MVARSIQSVFLQAQGDIFRTHSVVAGSNSSGAEAAAMAIFKTNSSSASTGGCLLVWSIFLIKRDWLC